MKKMLLMSVLLMTTILMVPTFAESASVTETETWVMMHGRITLYGDTPVALGWCGACAKVDRWARVRAFWAPTIPSRPIDPSSSFTFSFYTAKLVNASIVKINYAGNDFYVFGLWDVYNVTFAYHGDGTFTLTIDLMVNDADGELSVPNLLPGEDFTIDISGVKLITGKVKFACAKSIEIPNADGIPLDVSGTTPGIPDGKVNIWDLAHVAKAYGSTPGLLNFDFSMDFNFDFKVGLCELTTIAANIGREY